MKGALILVGGALSLLGGILFVAGWFGPHSGDGFENVGRIIVGVPIALVGLIALAAGLTLSGSAGKNEQNDRS